MRLTTKGICTLLAGLVALWGALAAAAPGALPPGASLALTTTPTSPRVSLPLIRDARLAVAPTPSATSAAEPTSTAQPTATQTATGQPTATQTATGQPAATQTATPSSTSAPPTPTRDPAVCDSSYPTICIPPPPPDLNCGNIAYRNFTVLPPDSHRFDSDKDGIGCEVE